MTEAEPGLNAALAHWGLSGASTRLIAERENRVFRVETATGPLALRLHRPGLRTDAELRSELQWTAMLAEGGVTVAAPLAAPDGSFYLQTNDGVADLLGWLDGTPLSEQITQGADVTQPYQTLARIMARMHRLADGWTLPEGFTRPRWDADGLIGEAPLWGQFWKNPHLTADQAAHLRDFRDYARQVMAKRDGADTGLIHADLVPENVLVSGNDMQIIDFDDGGFGDRLFDLATVANRANREDPSGKLARAFIDAYAAARPSDLTDLPLFMALRACTYVGWIVPRLSEAGAHTRNPRFINEAMTYVTALPL